MTFIELLIYNVVTIIAVTAGILAIVLLIRRTTAPEIIYSDDLPSIPPPIITVRTRAPIADEPARLAISGWTESEPTRQVVEDLCDVLIADYIDGIRGAKTAQLRDEATGALDAIYRFRHELFKLAEVRRRQ